LKRNSAAKMGRKKKIGGDRDEPPQREKSAATSLATPHHLDPAKIHGTGGTYARKYDNRPTASGGTAAHNKVHASGGTYAHNKVHASGGTYAHNKASRNYDHNAGGNSSSAAATAPKPPSNPPGADSAAHTAEINAKADANILANAALSGVLNPAQPKKKFR
jgi:hypothetical protein